tara:strand:- start:162 stop:512 length:351 start_codon:yes stop_codon:yes gene_type:complete
MTKEKDPNGFDQHTPGAKMDAGKVRVGLMMSGFSRALEEVAKVTTYGAEKYTPNGWKSLNNAIERYGDALARHQLKGYKEEIDESGLRHSAMLCWNALAKLELELERESNETDKHN